MRPYRAGPSFASVKILLMLMPQEFLHQMAKLPEKGREVVKSLSQHISARDWDLSERAMHALHNIASAPGAWHAFVVRSHFCSLNFGCKLPKHAPRTHHKHEGPVELELRPLMERTGSGQDLGLRQ